MKLYLSSYRIPTPAELFGLLNANPEDIRTAIIPNAKDYYADRARAVKIKETTDYLLGLGLRSEVVDLREYDDEEVLIQKLSDFQLIWVVGGNTYCLRHEMRRSGFEIAITELLERGGVYAGESAGACAAGNSLVGLETADDPLFAESAIYDGLNLVPHFILPHIDNAMFVEDIEHVRQIHKDDSTVIELMDAQALVIHNDQQRITTALKPL